MNYLVKNLEDGNACLFKGLNIHSFEDNQHQPNNIYLQNKNKKYILDNKILITKTTEATSFKRIISSLKLGETNMEEVF